MSVESDRDLVVEGAERYEKSDAEGLAADPAEPGAPAPRPGGPRGSSATPMLRSPSRRQFLSKGALLIGTGGALSFLDAGNHASASTGTTIAGCIPNGERPTTSPVHALPKPVRHNLHTAMRRAIEVAKAGETAFGAVLVDVANGRIVKESANVVRKTGDPSAHAELEVLRLGALSGVNLKNTVLVTTAESCPMCAACAIYVHVAGVAYGTSLEFLINVGRGSIRISQAQVVAAGPVKMPVVGGVLHKETDPLFTPSHHT
jgi:tRNA(Arg) A34 adenosine deaminase TadA